MKHFAAPRLAEIASACVADMGDIFWDFSPERDAPNEFTDPRALAVAEVQRALARLAEVQAPGSTRDRELARACGELLEARRSAPTEDELVAALSRAPTGGSRPGEAAIRLAMRYGPAVLRCAFSLSAVIRASARGAALRRARTRRTLRRTKARTNPRRRPSQGADGSPRSE